MVNNYTIKKGPQFFSKTIDKAIKTIELLSSLKGSGYIGLTDLSKELKIDKSSVYRILNTLQYNGYLVKNGFKYKLGPKILSISAKILDKLDIREIAHPHLENLARDTNEMSYLTILESDEVVMIDKVEGNPSIRIFSKIGSRFPLYCTATGKIFLAFLPQKETNELLSKIRLKKLTPHTITDMNKLKKQLKIIKEKKYATGDLEHDLLKRTIGAPIFNHMKEIIGAIGISGSINTLTENKLYSLVDLIKSTAEEISNEAGLIK